MLSWWSSLPGLDSTKEELVRLAEAFLDRGLATLNVDGPGQGETGLQLPIRPDYYAAISAVLDSLATRDEIDLDRLGLCGTSLGGFYAPLVAAHEPRVKVMVGISGPYDFSSLWPALPELSRGTFITRAGVSSEEDALELASQLNLNGLCQNISATSLYVTGDNDRLVPWQQTQRQAAETPRAEFVCYPGGSHGASNRMHIARPMIADWIKDQLSELG